MPASISLSPSAQSSRRFAPSTALALIASRTLLTTVAAALYLSRTAAGTAHRTDESGWGERRQLLAKKRGRGAAWVGRTGTLNGGFSLKCGCHFESGRCSAGC